MPNTPPRLGRVFQKYDPPLYFVTFNTHHRRNLLANKRVHRCFIQFGRTGEKRGIAAGRFVIMPNHVHLFVRGSHDVLLAQWVRLLKRALSKGIVMAHTHWQKGFFNHLVRHRESYAAKWHCVRENPVRAGLASNAGEWPWQGELERIEV